MSKNDRLTIGQMAKLHNVSERALRLYHKMGLLVPQYVDDENSYRYYDASQSLRLDMILHMKSMGVPLKLIKTMLDTKDIALYEMALHQQAAVLQAQIDELKQNKLILQQKIASCQHFLNPPSLNHVYIEYQPERTAFIFDVDRYDYTENYEKNLHCWENVLKDVKKQMADNGMPVTYFADVGAFIFEEDIKERRFRCGWAFILADDRPRFPSIKVQTIPAGAYVCMYDRWYSGNSEAEIRGLNALMDYIEQRGLEICGHEVSEVVAESLVFDCDNHYSLIKMQIPIKINLNFSDETANAGHKKPRSGKEESAWKNMRY